MVSKPKQEWDELNKKKVQLNGKVAKLFISYNVLLIEMNLIVFGNVS